MTLHLYAGWNLNLQVEVIRLCQWQLMKIAHILSSLSQTAKNIHKSLLVYTNLVHTCIVFTHQPFSLTADMIFHLYVRICLCRKASHYFMGYGTKWQPSPSSVCCMRVWTIHGEYFVVFIVHKIFWTCCSSFDLIYASLHSESSVDNICSRSRSL